MALTGILRDDEERKAAEFAERQYAISSRPASVTHDRSTPTGEVSSDYISLHDPVAHVLREAMKYVIAVFDSHKGGEYPADIRDLMQRGGLVRFDRGAENPWLDMVYNSFPEGFEGTISDEVLDDRIMVQIGFLIPSAIKGLRRPDRDREVGLSHEDLRDRLTQLSVFQTGRLYGLDAAKTELAEIRGGKQPYQTLLDRIVGH